MGIAAHRRLEKTGQQSDLVVALPPPYPRERLAHGPVVRMETPILDIEGELSRPYVGLDTLARLERAGTIGVRERRAGNRFHDEFRRAHLDQLFAADIGRIPVILACGNRAGGEGNEAAQLVVASALDALGGSGSPGASCVWHVLGCELTVEQWALSRHWSGRRVNPMFASGVLVTSLSILREHFKY